MFLAIKYGTTPYDLFNTSLLNKGISEETKIN
jgi:hypothetical protein